MKSRINPLFEEILKNIPEETRRRIEKKSISCGWLRNGDECGAGFPGTPCDVIGCAAWESFVKQLHMSKKTNNESKSD